MATTTYLFLLFLTSTTLCGGAQIQTLNGDWTLDGADAGITIPATVPGGVFSDLMAHGDIDDIFYGQGETDYTWVGESDWTYTTTFTVDDQLLANRVVNLIFEGLDTFATISINGAEIGTTENMFRRYVFDIKEQLQSGSNELSVKFTSAVNKAKELATNPNNTYPIPPDCPPTEYGGICYVNRIRKMQASFSWDWGPAFASMGIWKDVYLQGFNEAAIDHVVVNTYKGPNGYWTVVLTTYLNGGGVDTLNGTLVGFLEYEDGYEYYGEPIHLQLNENNEFVHTMSWEVVETFIGVWWPNGYGAQPLHNMTVTFEGETEEDEKIVRFGFRTVELIQQELGDGLSFYFRINGRPIFAKGANEIPLSVLPEKGQDPATIKHILQSAKDANMNMLRVWGGGVYESDYFYDLADEYGIMIWQDFMFACALYPADDDFLGNVVEEARHQLKRLGSHPSIVIWAGNNENEIVLAQNWYGTSDNFDLYKADYNKLFVDTIQTEVLRILPNVTYVTSSPSNGLESDQEDHVAGDPQNVLYGDVHFYDYSSDSWSLSTFPIPRFASEYGYQSMPSVESWLTATNDTSDLSPDAAFLNKRQHHPGGNQQNLDLIGQQLQLPDPSSENYIQAFIYFSQILQAQSIKIETEKYRSFKRRVNAQGQGYTMGSLYWQLNDVWVAPTWSGIDFTGRWKMLHYFAQQFYSPMIVTASITSADTLEIYADADVLDVPDQEVSVVLRIYKWDSLEPVLSEEFPVHLDPTHAVLVALVDVPSTLTAAGCGDTYEEARSDCFFHFHLMDQNDTHLAPFNYVFPQKLKDSNLANANVQIFEVSHQTDDYYFFKVTVTTDAPALFVWLDSHNIKGKFSENGFLLVEHSKTVNFTSEEPITLEDLFIHVTVTHLRDPAYL